MLKKLYNYSKTFLALVGCILLIFQVYKFVAWPRNGLFAIFSSHQFFLPHRIDSMAEQKHREVFGLYIDSVLATAQGRPLKRSVEQRRLSLSLPNDLFFFFKSHTTCGQLFLKNESNKAIQSIKVNYSGDFVYQYWDKQENIHYGQAHGSFSIPLIAPSEAMFIDIWTPGTAEEVLITSSEGSTDIVKRHTAYGLAGDLGGYFNSLEWLFMLVLSGAWLVYCAYHIAYAKGVKDKKSARKQTKRKKIVGDNPALS